MAPERAGPDPHELAARAQLIHPGGRVGPHPARQTSRSHTSAGQRQALERHERIAQPIDARAGRRMAVDALPGGHEARERTLIGGLDLLAQHGQRGAPQAAQHLGIAPLALGAAGPELAADEVARALELAQRRRGIDPVAGVDLGGRERSVGGRVAAHQPRERIGNLLEKRRRQPTRRR